MWGFDVVLKSNISQTCFGIWDMIGYFPQDFESLVLQDLIWTLEGGQSITIEEADQKKITKNKEFDRTKKV